MSFNIGLWRSYAQASAEQAAAARALLAGRWQPVVRSALLGREGSTFREAVDFAASRPSKQFIDQSLEVLARVAAEGGTEHGDMVRLLEAANPAAVADVCGKLAHDAAGNIDEVDFPELAAIFALLKQFGPRDGIGELAAAASHSTDPGLRDLAADAALSVGVPHAGATTVADSDVGARHPRESPADKEVPDDIRALWARYAQAQQRLMASRAALFATDYDAVLVQALADGDEAALRLLVHLMKTWGGRGDAVPKRILDALAQAGAAERAMSELIDYVAANPTSSEAFYADVIDALGYVGLAEPAELAERVRESAAHSLFPRVRQVAQS